MKSTTDIIKSIIFTNRCKICGKVINLDEELCNECKNLPRVPSPICTYCGVEKAKCHCKEHKMQYKKIVAPFYYEGVMVGAVHNLKFNEYSFLADEMGREVGKIVLKMYDDISFDVITFVPSSRIRKAKRGYNQAELIAKSVSKVINVDTVPLLKKIRFTKSQRRQTAKMRIANVYGAFDVISGIDVNDKSILLIDDVKTTGATLNECARALRLGGANVVYAATVAVVNH